MEESYSSNHHVVAQDSLRRGQAMRSQAKLLTAIVLGLGTIASRLVSYGYSLDMTTTHETSHPHLRLVSSRSSSSDFERVLEEAANNETTTCGLDCCRQYESELCVEPPGENDWIAAIPFAVQILLIILLIFFSALFSGLTLGLMSLDKTGLEIVMGGDDPKAAEYARAIYPVREDGNLLLCTLLLGNVAVNALLSILMAEYAGGIVGFVTSTFLIVIFGEIVPQAVVRYS